MISLRNYQKECIAQIKSHVERGNRRLLISLPTGAGKTIIFAQLINDLRLNTLILANNTELLDQAKSKLKMIAPEIDVGLLNATSKELNSSVVVSSIQSARNPQNLEKLKHREFSLMICDEAHHCGSESFRYVINELGFGNQTKQLLCGFTATPFRTDNKNLGEIFDCIAYEKTPKELIEEGYLCQPKGVKVATNIDLSKVQNGEDGDFQVSSLSAVMDTPEINQLIADSYIKEGLGRQAICFGTTVQHAKNLTLTFESRGISSAPIFGTMPSIERETILKAYKEGSITVLCNCQILTEGFDAPETSCVIVGRPTKSKGLYQQMVGRGLRPFPNKKECLILDFSDTTHSICNTATLLDNTQACDPKRHRDEQRIKRELIKKLPPKLNQKLKVALVSFDPLGESYLWKKEGGAYVLSGGRSQLIISPECNDLYQIILNQNGSMVIIAKGLSFEYAFGAAEDYARNHRSMFVMADREAHWRNQPISEKQKACFRSYGYRSGIKELTKGQASDLLASGILKRTG